MSADFTPGLSPYKETGTFRFWCQKVLPLVYDDSLSYYELLCKVVNYLNDVISNVDGIRTDTEALRTAYIELQTYVNNYFDDLDVQEAINTKLNAMASDGTLTALIEPFIPEIVSDWLQDNLTPTNPPIDATLSISGAAADAKVTGDKISEIDNNFINYQSGILPRKIIKDSYVNNTTGIIAPYTGWNRTDYIPVNEYNSLTIKSSIASGFNVFYNSSKERISDFIVSTTEKTILVPDSAAYVIFSNTAEGMENLTAQYNTSAMTPKKISENETAIDNLVDMGVYHISRTILQNITDKPSDADDAVATLICYAGAYAGGSFTIQILLQLSGKRWERIVNTLTKEISEGWHRTDIEYYKYATENELETLTKNETAINNGVLYPGPLIPDIYIDNNRGTEVAYNGWSATDFIQIPEVLKESIIVNSPGLSTFNCFYDTQKQYISSFTTPAGTAKIIPPSNAVYMRLSNTTANMTGTVIYGPITPYSNYLRGKKLVTAGDSYTAASWSWSQDYAQYDGKNFGYYIAKRNGMAFVNAGISGSTMAVPNSGNHNPFVVNRYQEIPEDTDYLTLWFGINDAVNCTLGTIDDESTTTFYGAWNTVLRYYLTNRPWLKILIIVTTGATEQFRQAVRDVARKWGYPYLDWVEDDSLPAFFDRDGMSTEARNLRRAAFGYNGPNEGHPNPQWYEYESTIIEAKLRSI